MRAIVVREFVPPENARVDEFPAPRIGAGEVLIDVHAAGINFPDLLAIAGKYQVLPPRPFVAGRECAGVVREVAAGVSSCAPGDRVLAFMEHGAFAEQVAIAADKCFVLPQGMRFDEAAGFALVYLTAYFALVERARMRSGDVVLVTGASGGVGIAALQIAKALGATVLAAVSTAEKGTIARANGADHLIDVSVPNLRDALREQVRKATGGRGADVVVEMVGGDVFDASLRALAWSGRLVVVGFAGGRIPEVKANYLLVKNIAVLGLQVSDYRDAHAGMMREAMNALFALYARGAVKPLVSASLPLERIAEGFAMLTSRKAIGKVVVHMDAGRGE